jgi:hypothetical protein
MDQVTPPAALAVATPGAAPGAVVELLGRDGRVQLVQRVSHWPARIGRSAACAVVLDDPHLAPEHAELDCSPDGVLSLRLLPSLNGGWAGEQRLAEGEAVALLAGQGLTLGASHLRVRASNAALAPERPLLVLAKRHWLLLPGLLLLLLLTLWFERWSSVDPDSRWIDYAWPLLGPLAFVLGWAGLWSLATQLFQHRFPFARHLRRVLIVLVGMSLVEWLLPLVAFAFSWPRLMAMESLLTPVAAAALVAWHASEVWPGAKRVLSGGIAALLVLGLGLQAGNRLENQYLFGPPYLASIAPPAARLVLPKTPEALIESLRPLRADLAKQARKDDDSIELPEMEQ